MRGKTLLWILIGLLVVLDVWYDFHHAQGWLIIDGLLILVVGIALLKYWIK